MGHRIFRWSVAKRFLRRTCTRPAHCRRVWTFLIWSVLSGIRPFCGIAAISRFQSNGPPMRPTFAASVMERVLNAGPPASNRSMPVVRRIKSSRRLRRDTTSRSCRFAYRIGLWVCDSFVGVTTLNDSTAGSNDLGFSYRRVDYARPRPCLQAAAVSRGRGAADRIGRTIEFRPYFERVQPFRRRVERILPRVRSPSIGGLVSWQPPTSCRCQQKGREQHRPNCC